MFSTRVNLASLWMTLFIPLGKVMYKLFIMPLRQCLPLHHTTTFMSISLDTFEGSLCIVQYGREV